MPHFTLLTFDNCLASGVTGLLDVFNIANQIWQLTQQTQQTLFTWRLVSVDGQPVRASVGLPLAVAGNLDTGLGADLILLPAIHYHTDDQLLAQTAQLSRACAPWLHQARRAEVLLAACCTSSFVLAQSHLLEGKQATTSWWLGQLFQYHYPKVNLCLDELITEDNGIFCAGAIAAHLDMGLRLVKKFAGDYLALACAKTMLIDANRTSQTPYMMLQAQAGYRDDLVLQAQEKMQAQLQQPFNLSALAAELHVSQRTLVRRFQQATHTTPNAYWQKLRVETAKRLLETTALSFEEIVARVGYTDPSAFRRLFKRETQLAPRDYRRRFAIGG